MMFLICHHTITIALTLSSFTAGFTTPHPNKFLGYRTSSFHESSFDDDFVEMQGKVSNANMKKGRKEKEAEKAMLRSNITDKETEFHLNHQREVFDEMSTFFNSEEATPEDVKPLLQFIAKRALSEMIGCGESVENCVNASLREKMLRNRKTGKFSVLDIGCGTGALFPFYLEAADELGIELDIVGLDLSEKMVKCANENAREMIKENKKHSIQCQVGDFVEFVTGGKVCRETFVGFECRRINEDFEENFDAVVINALFGNFIDPNSVVAAAATSLKVGGVFVISHPLGSDFVQKLNNDNPLMVPNLLPTRYQQEVLEQYQPLTRLNFATINEHLKDNNIGDDKANVSAPYFASYTKVPCRMLKNLVRLRGPVDQGYGRGGKKLGFPTANLPSSLFSNALTTIPNGVYIGWAMVEGSSSDECRKGRNIIHKAVVNVGYSPTFEGEENKEKIVEAHLIVKDGVIEGDFYGETMRLELIGFLRPEKRFPSFADLIAAINNDVENAKTSLSDAPYSLYGSKFHQVPLDGDKVWVGITGGDAHASFEFEKTPFWK